jgi:hypothetical protein
MVHARIATPKTENESVHVDDRLSSVNDHGSHGIDTSLTNTRRPAVRVNSLTILVVNDSLVSS